MSFAKDDVSLSNISALVQAGILKTRIVKETANENIKSATESENEEKVSFSESLSKRLSSIQDTLEKSQEGGTMLNIASYSFSSISDNLSEIKSQLEKLLKKEPTSEDLKEASDSIGKKLGAIEKTVNDTTFNGKKLLDGSVKDSVQIENSDGKKINISSEFKNTSLKALGLPENEDFSVKSKEEAEALLKKIETAEKDISARQTKVSEHQEAIQSSVKDLFLTEINLVDENSSENVIDQIKNNAISSIFTNADESVKMQIKSLDENVLLALIRLKV
jgi:flagellin-like hook-associated protein FlgL